MQSFSSKKNLTYILFGLPEAQGFRWIAEKLDQEKFNLSFISIGTEESTPFKFFCENKKLKYFTIPYKDKIDILTATVRAMRILLKLKTEIVHCHIFEANIIGLTAAFLGNVKTRIYTRHHSTIHHEHHPIGILLDKYCNAIATKIISISDTVSRVLIAKEGVDTQKISHIPHGIDIENFSNVSQTRIKKLINRYNQSGKWPVFGVIARHEECKGIHYIAEAFKTLLKIWPDALLVLANAKGSCKISRKAVNDLPNDNYVEIEFEEDNCALYKIFDVFIHTPINAEGEAFGLVYVEALAAGVPSIFTISGIAKDFIKNKENALVVSYRNPNQIVDAAKEILESAQLRQKLIENGKSAVAERFSLETFIARLEAAYI